MWTAHHKGQGINRRMVIVKWQSGKTEFKRCLISVVILTSGQSSYVRDLQPLYLCYGKSTNRGIYER